MNFDEAVVQCPHCGEPLSVPIDPSQGSDQSFIEDCAVCCKPLVIKMRWGYEETPTIEVERS